MTTLTVYDPAMCCATGICGADVDQRLVNFAADLDWLKSEGIEVKRINISNEPMEFATNPKIKAVLDSDGVDGLPVILINGDTHSQGRFPERAELAGWAGVDFAETEAKSSGCCGESSEPKADSGCCDDTASEATSGCC
ncbi:MAG: arsenite efflux transporter metallochaperone ArsD [Rhodobacteraceae bacterium]|nr:arsenite efflux transporter metallochaperone ArsD [Paracoccaceae bacterium]